MFLWVRQGKFYDKAPVMSALPPLATHTAQPIADMEPLVARAHCRATSGLEWLFKSYGGLSEAQCCALLVRKQEQMLKRAGISRATRRRLFDGIPRPPPPPGVGGGEGATISKFAHTKEETLTTGPDGSPLESGPLNLMAVEGQLCEGNKYFSSSPKSGKRAGGGVYKGHGADKVIQGMLKVVAELLSQTWGGVVCTPRLEGEEEEAATADESAVQAVVAAEQKEGEEGSRVHGGEDDGDHWCPVPQMSSPPPPGASGPTTAAAGGAGGEEYNGEIGFSSGVKREVDAAASGGKNAKRLHV